MLHFCLLAVLYYIVLDCIILCYNVIYFTILCCTASCCTILYYAMHTIIYFQSHMGLMFVEASQACSLFDNDLRRAVCDSICDENFDDWIATCLPLDFCFSRLWDLGIVGARAGGIAAHWPEPKNVQKHMQRPLSFEWVHNQPWICYVMSCYSIAVG